MSLKGLFVSHFADILSSIIITGLVRVVLGYPKGKRVPSYSNAEVWTTVHAGMSIVCASLPIFRPLAGRIAASAFVTKISSLPRYLGVRTASSSNKSSQKLSQNSSLSVKEVEQINAPEDRGNIQGMMLQLPTTHIVEESELSLSAQWAGYLEHKRNNDRLVHTTHEAV